MVRVYSLIAVAVFVSAGLASLAEISRTIRGQSLVRRTLTALPDSTPTTDNTPKRKLAHAVAPEAEPEFEIGPTAEPVPVETPYVDPVRQYYVKETSIGRLITTHVAYLR